jgi:hypothetical protein
MCDGHILNNIKKLFPGASKKIIRTLKIHAGASIDSRIVLTISAFLSGGEEFRNRPITFFLSRIAQDQNYNTSPPKRDFKTPGRTTDKK